MSEDKTNLNKLIMKEYIIQLTKKKTAILAIPTDCSVSDINILLKKVPVEIQKNCKHEDVKWNYHNQKATCKCCGKLMN